MNDTSNRLSWLAVLGLLVCVVVAALSSCQALRRVQPPYHEPRITPSQTR